VERLGNQLIAPHQLNAALQATQRRLITEREDERKMLARELHDQMSQDLLGLNYRLEEIESVEKSSAIQREVASIRQELRNVVGGTERYPASVGDRPGFATPARNDPRFLLRSGYEIPIIGKI